MAPIPLPNDEPEGLSRLLDSVAKIGENLTCITRFEVLGIFFVVAIFLSLREIAINEYYKKRGVHNPSLSSATPGSSSSAPAPGSSSSVPAPAPNSGSGSAAPTGSVPVTMTLAISGTAPGSGV